jgi:spore germination protein (amino acid permease)
MNHVMVIPPLLQVAKRDAWISVLAMLLPYLIWATILYFIMRRTKQQQILTWLYERYGIVASSFFRAFFVLYLFLISVMTIKETSMWTHASYLPRTPTIVVGATLVLLCGYAAYAGLRSIAIASGFLLPLVILFGDFVMSANIPKKNYTLLTPMLENGISPILQGCMYVGGGLAEFIILLLIQHHLTSKVRLWSIWTMCAFLILLVFSPVTGAIAEFGPYEAAELRYPAFEEWRLVSIGKYIRHVDFLSIHQWLSGAFVRIALAIFMLIELLAVGCNKKTWAIWTVILCLAILFIASLPVSDMQYLRLLRNYYLPGSLMAARYVPQLSQPQPLRMSDTRPKEVPVIW